MKKILFLLLSFSLSLIANYSLADLAGYNIKEYDVQLTLQKEGAMDVHETIVVNFSEPRHGIYRNIPFYRDSQLFTDITNIQVLNGDNYTSYDEDENYKIRIGDANETLIWEHTYDITYTVTNAVTKYGEWTGASWRTELYRNVIGNDRETTIDNVKVTVTIPTESEFSPDTYYLVYGKLGEKKSDSSQFAPTGTGSTTFHGAIKTQLQNHEGVTLGIKFPNDYFTFPEEYFEKQTERIRQEERDSFLQRIENLIQWVIVIIICIGAFMSGQHNKPYKSKLPVTIYYTPPKDVDVTLAGKIYNIQDSRIITALIYFWITQGYLTLEAQKKWVLSSQKYFLHATNKPLELEYHKELFKILFPSLSVNIQNSTVTNKVLLNDIAYSKIERCEREIESTSKQSIYFQKTKKKLLLIPYDVTELSEKGKEIYEEIRGFEYYLTHVETERMAAELKQDPDYIDKVLPRAVLFGVETKFLKAVEEIMKTPYEPNRYTGTNAFSIGAISALSSSIQSFARPPVNSGGTGSSWFSGGGSSWGGGWGGGGGSR